MKKRLYIVDVFAEKPYAGNQLAVVIIDEDLSDALMQQIAAEMNFSETTFVRSAAGENGGYDVRVFTPASEVAFTGHPILGTAWVVRQHVVAGDCVSVRLNLAVGQVTVTFDSSAEGREVTWFRAPTMALGDILEREPMAAALGLSPQDIETGAPIQVVSAGTAAIIVPVCSLAALVRGRLDLDAFASLAAIGYPPLVYLFCRETHQPRNDVCARFFFDALGVREDPATGNGAAFLGAYLLEHRLYHGSDLSIRIEQGYEILRPSLIFLHARMLNGVREVNVGGYVIPVVQGDLL